MAWVEFRSSSLNALSPPLFQVAGDNAKNSLDSYTYGPVSVSSTACYPRRLDA